MRADDESPFDTRQPEEGGAPLWTPQGAWVMTRNMYAESGDEYEYRWMLSYVTADCPPPAPGPASLERRGIRLTRVRAAAALACLLVVVAALLVLLL